MLTPEYEARRLYQLHQTRNPFELAKKRKLNVFFKPLGNIFGFYFTLKRSRFIYINSESNPEMQVFTCAHEIGHDVLHPGINTPFLAKNTLQSVDKIERQASQFAVELLIPNQLLVEGMTIYEAAAACGVPAELAHLKKEPRAGFWSDETSYIGW
jgi:Zn-dependent peptidase ImmA (M78 family)